VEDWNWETIFYGHYRSIFNHCDISRVKICRIRWKTQNKGYYGVQGHSRSSRSVPIESSYATCYLLVINSNWHPISYRFGVIAAYCSNFGHCVFEPPFGGLETTYDVHLGLIGVDFLLELIEFFGRCYGWESRSEKRSKIGNFAQMRSVWSKISGRRDHPHQSFLHG